MPSPAPWTATILHGRPVLAAALVLIASLGRVKSETVFINREEQLFRLWVAQYACNDSGARIQPREFGDDCLVEWDSIGCWPRTPAGRTMVIPCPNYINKFETEASTSRHCWDNGTWETFPEKNRTLVLTERYRSCFGKSWTANGALDVPTVIQDHLPSVILIYDVGYTISIAALLISLFIMIAFRKLHCPRNTVHINLFISFVLRAGMTLLKNHLFVDQNALPKDLIAIDGKLFFNPDDTHWECKTLTTATHYAAAASFTWIFMEGLYLHVLIFSTTFSDTSSVKHFVIFGWLSPLLYVIPYTLVRIFIDDNECWNNFMNRDFRWIIDGPMVMTVVVNFVFFLNVIRVLFSKLHASNVREARKYRYKKLAKSTLVLIPVFGVPWMVFLILDIYPDVTAEVVRFYFDTIFSSFQGFLVSLLFCFLNGEVQTEIRKKCLFKECDVRFPWDRGPRTKASPAQRTSINHSAVSGSCNPNTCDYDLSVQNKRIAAPGSYNSGEAQRLVNDEAQRLVTEESRFNDSTVLTDPNHNTLPMTH